VEYGKFGVLHFGIHPMARMSCYLSIHYELIEHLYSPIAVENKSENRINTT